MEAGGADDQVEGFFLLFCVGFCVFGDDSLCGEAGEGREGHGDVRLRVGVSFMSFLFLYICAIYVCMHAYGFFRREWQSRRNDGPV